MRFYSIGQLSNTEKSNILDKHKELYNGYKKVWQPVSNEQPLYTQDFANDKNGLVVNNQGNVKQYTNFGINEMWQMLAADALAGEIAGAELAPMIAPTIQKKMEEVGDRIKDAFSGIKSPTSLEKTEMSEVNIEDLKKNKKYKYETPSFEDEIEWESEYDYPEGGEKMYGFKGEKAGHAMARKHIEDYVKDIEEDIYDVQDIDPKAKFDYIEEDLENFTSAFSDDIEEEVGGPLYSEVKPAYDFVSDGPLREDDLDEMFYDTSDWDKMNDSPESFSDDSFDKEGEDEKYSAFDKMRRGYEIEDIDWEDIDDELKESLLVQHNKINEMFDRLSKFN